MIIKKGESPRPKMYSQWKNGQTFGGSSAFYVRTFWDSSCISVRTFGDSSCISVKTFRDSSAF